MPPMRMSMSSSRLRVITSYLATIRQSSESQCDCASLCRTAQNRRPGRLLARGRMRFSRVSATRPGEKGWVSPTTYKSAVSLHVRFPSGPTAWPTCFSAASCHIGQTAKLLPHFADSPRDPTVWHGHVRREVQTRLPRGKCFFAGQPYEPGFRVASAVYPTMTS